MMLLEDLKEIEIREIFRESLIYNNFSVFPEINRIDLVAIKNGVSHGFELKSVSGSSFKALGQAMRNYLYVNYSWIVLPLNLLKNDFLQSLQRMKVGLIVVNRDLSFSILKMSANIQQPAKTLLISPKKLQKNLERRTF
ncbi:MAG: hypothetical protein ACXAEU_24910 [Candidatus Hodarchaeales archaeon]|jgi:hypothetical protein